MTVPTFDNELYTSVYMPLIAKRSILISSDSPKLTAAEIQSLLLYLMGFEPNKQTTTIELNESSIFGDNFIDVLGLSNGEITNQVLILIGIEQTSVEFQRTLSRFLKSKRVTINNIEYKANDGIFTVFGLIESKNSSEVDLDKSLNNCMWFRHTHYMSTSIDNDTKSDNNSTDSDLESLEKLKDVNLLRRDTLTDISRIRSESEKVTIIPELKTYIYDIAVFTRLHRMVQSGLPTFTMKDIECFVRIYAVLNEYTYVIPEMIKLCGFKLLPLRIKLITKVEHEKTLMYGSDLHLVEEISRHWNRDLVVENILDSVPPPV